MVVWGQNRTAEEIQQIVRETAMGPNPFDEAQSFTESGLTVTHDKTALRSGSISLNHPKVSWNPYLSSSDGGAETQKKDIDFTGNETLDCNFNQSGQYASIEVFIDGNSVFYDSGGSSCSYQHDISGMSGVHTVKLEHTDRYNGDGSGEYVDCDLNELGQVITSGTVILEWARPSDIYQWDVATFTRTLDGEAVDVFVAYNDGSGWTRTNGGNPISRNYSLQNDSNISASDDVRIEADLQRANTSNNPTLDSAYRSWMV